MPNHSPPNPGFRASAREKAYFLAGCVVALLFRLYFVWHWRFVTDDSLIYGDIAKNWLLHHVYALSGVKGPDPTGIRMPGYPGFLAAIWTLIGVEHYTGAILVQVVVDVGTCLVIADLTRRIVSQKAAKIAFTLAALCPFFANYAAAALSESLEVFFTALALDLGVSALNSGLKKEWALCGFAIAGAIFQRPDGGILLAAFGIYLSFRCWQTRPELKRRIVSWILVLFAVALAPLIPWTIRNWRSLHLFQPLVPEAANSPDEFVAVGFGRWMRTWVIDYSSIEDIGFKVPGEKISIADVPNRAFANSSHRAITEELFNDYNQHQTMTPAVDARFDALAQEQIHAHPMSYYVLIPTARAASLWLRPRIETLPLDTHWWHLKEDPHDFAWAALLGLINLMYLAAAARGLLHGGIRYEGVLLIFVLFRTAFMSWLPNPEPRYVLECYPVLLVLAAAGLTRFHKVSASY